MNSLVVVVGAGAAGLMAAWHAARDARVVLLERKRDGGRKILISGGGRCNILPERLQPERFVTDSSPHTLRNLLLGWPLDEQLAFFERELGIPLRLEEGGKYFPTSGLAKDVRDRLLAAVESRGVERRGQHTVRALRPEGAQWRVECEESEPLVARAVVLATGGLSVPNTGSDGSGLRLARDLGHRVVEPYPALTPLLGDDPRHHALAGLSVPARLKAGRDEYTGSLLFTHRGYSGPVVLDASHHVVRERAALHVRWGARERNAWEARLEERGRRPVRGVLREELPERLADHLLDEAGVPRDRTLAELRREEKRALLDALTHTRLRCSGHEGYRKAEVTGGGVALGEVEAKTLESRCNPGLFLCGEILDAFGPIGGHNFAWAWSTGRRAGLAAAERAATRAEGPPPA